ncbi:MAG: hypothetical protein ACP5IL_14925 [Syntrophobacteraceae bacterium]
MDRILFGDNQFFGINHLCEEKARAQSIYFQNSESILKVLDSAYALNIKTFMCTTHGGMGEICAHLRSNQQNYWDFKIYPCMPYAHKYANMLTEIGALQTMKRFLSAGITGAVTKGGAVLVNSDFISMMQLLVDAEMSMFEGIKTPVVFLQNVVTDLLLGMKMKDFFVSFSRYVGEKYHAEAGFITMNLPLLLDTLEEAGLRNPIICSSINKIGFRMSNIQAYEKVLNEREFRPVAMQVLAAGALKPVEAIEYICRFPKIESILFGASSYEHIKQTKELIEMHSGRCKKNANSSILEFPEPKAEQPCSSSRYSF